MKWFETIRNKERRMLNLGVTNLNGSNKIIK